MVEICEGCHVDVEFIDDKGEGGMFYCVFVEALCGDS